MRTQNIPPEARPALHARMSVETVYLLNDFEGMAVRFDPSGDAFVKPKGGAEFRAKDGSKVVADALLDPHEITSADYEGYS